MEAIRDASTAVTDVYIWDQAGDYLRDETNRSSALTVATLPKLIAHSNTIFEDYLKTGQNEQLILSNLRALINLSADNDENRKFICNESQFWRLIDELLLRIESLEVLERLLIFLNQFIYSNVKNEFLSCIFSELTSMPVIVKKNCNRDSFVVFFNELIAANLQQIVASKDYQVYIDYIDTFLTVFETLIRNQVQGEEDEEEEVYLALADIIFNLTTFDDLQVWKIDANYRTLKLIENISNDLENITHIKRKLFAASGNITSMKNYPGELEMALEYFKNRNIDDAYLLSALAITLGNYVNSLEKSEELNVIIERDFGMQSLINRFFEIKINDVIQIQNVHLLNNIVNANNVKYIMNNYNGLGKITKIVIDNIQYYPEIGTILYKFIKKLIKLQFIEGKTDIVQYETLWQLFSDNDNADQQEIKLLLLQSYIETPTTLTPLITNLITNAVTLNNTSVTIELILQRLKTLGMLMHNLNNKKITVEGLQQYYDSSENFTSKFLLPLNELLLKLKTEILDQAQNQPQYPMLLNNSKFVAASILSFLPNDPDTSTVREIIGYCKEITLL